MQVFFWFQAREVSSISKLPENSILVFKENDQRIYAGSPDLESLLPWVKENQFAYVSNFSESTYERLVASGRLLVLVIVDPADPNQQK